LKKGIDNVKKMWYNIGVAREQMFPFKKGNKENEKD
jgi:hypothetical protein